MATLNDLYMYYCRRWECRPNSAFSQFLEKEYAKNDNQRILVKVDVSNNYLGRKGIIPVLDLVKNTKTVKFLDVSCNRLEHEQLEHLCYCLAKHPSIETVYLCNNLLHDGSLPLLLELLEMNPSIVEVDISGNSFCPSSFERIEEFTRKNKEIQKQLQKEAESIEKMRRERPKPGYETSVRDSLREEESGGDIHFSTWWKNPQYGLRVCKDTAVSIVMKSLEDNSAKQCGFVVMRYDGIRRVVEIARRTVVVESPVSDTVCKVEVQLEEAGQYVIMPYTFRPGRSLAFELTATIIREKPTLEELWITLDKLDEKYDWCVQVIEGSWIKGKSTGGGPQEHTWRYNDMYHIRYTGPKQPFAESSKADICMRLFKALDPDNNDEREIGLNVMEHDTYANGLPPLQCTSDLVRTSYLHEHKAAIFHKFSCRRAGDLDYYIVPSTKCRDQAGTYTLVIFSTVPFEVVPSYFPHGWNYRLMDGEWDAGSCGGCREFYQSWKNNPAIELVMDTESKTSSIVVLLEIGENRGMVRNDPIQIASSKTPLPAAPEPDEADFLRRHRECLLEGCVAAVDAKFPKYALRRCSKMDTEESSMTLLDTSPTFYLVPMARHAGQLGTFRLHVFSKDRFVVESADNLSSREREAQLQQYAEENADRKKNTQQAIEGASAGVSQGELVAIRQAILKQCLSTGVKFSDRDFPRGFSSCWLHPEGPPPKDFPAKYQWVHASEVAPMAGCMIGGRMSPPFPFGRRHWFGSIINAVAAKPHMLSRLFVHYDPDAGVAQFQFFKADEWLGVTVDDYLLMDTAGDYLFGHSVNKADVLFPLMEKAYAKLHRCYEAMEMKVTPELSLVDVLLQGLKDVTGGHNELFTLNREKDVELTVEEREVIWRVLKRSTTPTVLQTLLLRSDDAGVGDRHHAGILPDHLYAVMDARFVENQRVVKLRNWHDPVDANWKGKWAPHSPFWTETLLDVLEYDHTQDEIWLSFDEVLYYFSNLIVTEESPSCVSIRSNFQVAKDTVEVDPHLEFPQYALTFSDVVQDSTPFKVVVELMQKDPRMSVTRIRYATAKYSTAIGLAVLATEDNNRTIKKLEPESIFGWIEPRGKRDLQCTLEIHPEMIKEQQFTLVPFLEDGVLGDRTTPYTLRISSSDVKVALNPVKENHTISLEGSWCGFTAGGPPEREVTWRDNPHYLLYPSETMEVNITLTMPEVAEKGVGAGFTVHTAKMSSSYLEFDPSSVVIHVPPTSPPSSAVTCAVFLQGMKERRGMPYIVVPYCSERGTNGNFQLQVIGNRKMNFSILEPRLDWHREVRIVKLRTFEGNTGGGLEYPSWRMNPQYVINFPATRQGRLVIAAENMKKGDRFNKIGLLLFRADSRWEGLHRRRIEYTEEDVIARTGEHFDHVQLDLTIDEKDHTEPYILMVYSNIPYREVDFRVCAYFAAPIEIFPVEEWKCTAITEGTWLLGKTAGGSRKNFSSWINNPFLGLSCIRPTQMVAVLIQYPHGPEKPITKRYKNKKAFLPPPIVNPHLRMAIELDLVNYDDTLSTIKSSGSAKLHEVILAAKLVPCSDRPYLLVPSTTIPEQNGDFKVLVYADHPVDLYEIEKPRVPYVYEEEGQESAV